MLGGKKRTKKVTKATKKRIAKAVINRHFASGGSLKDFWNRHKGKLTFAGLSLPTLAAAWMLFGNKAPDVLAHDELIHQPIYEEHMIGRDNPQYESPEFVEEFAEDDNLGYLQQLREAAANQRRPKYDDYDDYGLP